MNSKKLNALLRSTRSRMVYENHNLITQLNKLTREEKHARIWAWVKQGAISYAQFSFLLTHIEKDA